MLKVIFVIIISLGAFANYAVSSSNISCSGLNSSYCVEQLGPGGYCHTQLTNNTCECGSYFFQNGSKCQACPGIGESCEDSGCCGEYMVCEDLECVYCMDEYCWLVTNMDDAERESLQRVAQVILAVALLLTATILFILFWNACTRRTMARYRGQHRGQRRGESQGHRNRRPSHNFQSLTSIQRLVFMQLQDRPPPYNADQMTPWKHSCDITEPPPSYIEAMGLATILSGTDNPVFFIESPQISRTEDSPNSTSTQTSSEPTNMVQHHSRVENTINCLPNPQVYQSVDTEQLHTQQNSESINFVPFEEAQNTSQDQNLLQAHSSTSSELHI